MENISTAEKGFRLPVPIQEQIDENTDITEHKDGAEPIKFLTRLGVDCILNNLAQDYITGAELLLYVKTYVTVHTAVVFNEISEKLHIADASVENAEPTAGILNPQAILKRINKLLVKNHQSHAA